MELFRRKREIEQLPIERLADLAMREAQKRVRSRVTWQFAAPGSDDVIFISPGFDNGFIRATRAELISALHKAGIRKNPAIRDNPPKKPYYRYQVKVYASDLGRMVLGPAFHDKAAAIDYASKSANAAIVVDKGARPTPEIVYTTSPELRKNPAIRRNPAIPLGALHVRDTDYPAIFGDSDGDGIPDVDDPHPYAAGDTESIEETQLADEMRKLIALRDDHVETLQSTMQQLRKLAPARSIVTGRVKTPFSIINKLRRNRIFGPKGLTDIVGTRVVLADQRAVEAFRKKIEANFQIEELEDMYAHPKGGYRAYHYILVLPGHPPKKAELQVKTARMSAISDGSHAPYKDGTLDVRMMDRLTSLAAAADRGDQAAAREIDPIVKRGTSYVEHLLTRKS